MTSVGNASPRRGWYARFAIGATVLCSAAVHAQAPLVAYVIEGDAIVAPLTPVPGDPARGRSIATTKDEGGCILCHSFPGAAGARKIGPPLAGVGGRLSAGQLRLRVVDPTRILPDTAMPAYYRVDDLNQVASPYRGKPLLAAQQVEDVIAYLATLKAAP